MNCPECGNDIRDDANFCPECGADIDDSQRPGEESPGDATAADEGTRGGDTDRSGSGQPDPQRGEQSSGTGGTGSGGDDGRQSPQRDRSERRQERGRERRRQDAGGQDGQGRRRGPGQDQPQGQGGGRGQDQGRGRGQGRRSQAGQGGQGAGTRGAARAPQHAGGGGQSSSLLDALPLKQGAVAGAVAYLINYALVFVLFTVEIGDEQGGFTGAIQKHEYAGWVFYNAHSVKIETPYDPNAFSVLEGLYAGGMNSTTVPKLAYYALPVLVLLGAGWYLAANPSTGRQFVSGEDGAKAGATVAVGYAALAVLGALTIFSVSGSGQSSGALKPELGKTVLLMGLAYPAVAGAVGGYFGAQ